MLRGVEIRFACAEADDVFTFLLLIWLRGR